MTIIEIHLLLSLQTNRWWIHIKASGLQVRVFWITEQFKRSSLVGGYHLLFTALQVCLGVLSTSALTQTYCWCKSHSSHTPLLPSRHEYLNKYTYIPGCHPLPRMLPEVTFELCLCLRKWNCGHFPLQLQYIQTHSDDI